MSYYNDYNRDRDDDDSDDGYDAAKDAYCTGESDVPVTYNQRREAAEWAEECRRNRW